MSPFNSYDKNGFRTTVNGSRSSRAADEAIISNLRFRWADELKHMSDVELVNAYDEFALSEIFGNNDERFLEFLSDSWN